jgi:hypothetical protein
MWQIAKEEKAWMVSRTRIENHPPK